MKTFFFTLVSVLLLTSCATVNVRTDYDTRANFNSYKSFAFFKPSVDKLEISDLDKKRILRAVEAAMIAKGFVKSENPDILAVSYTHLRAHGDRQKSRMPSSA